MAKWDVDIGEAVLEEPPEPEPAPEPDSGLRYIVIGVVAAFVAGLLLGKGKAP